MILEKVLLGDLVSLERGERLVLRFSPPLVGDVSLLEVVGENLIFGVEGEEYDRFIIGTGLSTRYESGTSIDSQRNVRQAHSAYPIRENKIIMLQCYNQGMTNYKIYQRILLCFEQVYRLYTCRYKSKLNQN